MVKKKTIIAPLVGRKGERQKSAEKHKSKTPTFPTSHESEIQHYREFADLVRRLIGFFQARRLVHELTVFNSWTRGEQGDGTRYAAQLEQIDQSLEKMENLSSYASATEEPILRQLEEHVAALEAELYNATLDLPSQHPA